MAKTIKWILIIVSIGVILYLGMNFLVVEGLSYLSSVKTVDSLPEEKLLFTTLKKEYYLTQIERSPQAKQALLHPTDTLAYTLYLSLIDCDQKKENLERISRDMAYKIDTLNLDQNFYKYRLFFYCKKITPGILKYEFLRKDLK